MIKKVFGDRTGDPAFFDMAGRFKAFLVTQNHRSFNIGDRAAAYIWLGDWRARNPERRLVVIEDKFMIGQAWGRLVSVDWLFGGIADELWIIEKEGEIIPRPPGEAIYKFSVWQAWRTLRDNKIFNPSIVPLPEAMESVKKKLADLSVPAVFITVQPLFDAAHNSRFYRNGKIEWWEQVCSRLSNNFPAVILGAHANSSKMKAQGAYPLWNTDLSPMESLAAIYMARVHIGGMTGMTIWSPIFKVPTVAVYRYWKEYEPNGSIDERPFSFGAPVVWAPLEGNPEDLVSSTGRLWGGGERS